MTFFFAHIIHLFFLVITNSNPESWLIRLLLVSYCATVCFAPSLCLRCAKFGAFFANTDNDDDDDKPEANETLKVSDLDAKGLCNGLK